MTIPHFFVFPFEGLSHLRLPNRCHHLIGVLSCGSRGLRSKAEDSRTVLVESFPFAV
jgi:hypothetical protein